MTSGEKWHLAFMLMLLLFAGAAFAMREWPQVVIGIGLAVSQVLMFTANRMMRRKGERQSGPDSDPS